MSKIKGQSIYSEIILDSVTEGVFTVDSEWNITSFNRAAQKITGFSKEEALKSKCHEVFKTNRCESNCFLKQTMASGENIFDQRINIKNRHGDVIPISVNTALLSDSSGKTIGGVETFRDCIEIECLKKQLEKSYTLDDIIGKSKKIKDIMAILPDIAKSKSTVLIQGPSGSGKEVFARAIHNLNKEMESNDSPFIAVNCGAIPENLLESELFGHKKGAFTDARSDRPGKFELARGGTILLDEIGELSPRLQVKLLRVIQEKEFDPVGSSQSVQMDARLILATNRNLKEMVKKSEFRDDLYYRINVVQLNLPSLVERNSDIPLLVSHFLELENHITGKEIKNVSKGVMYFLMNYSYPGNIRELKNIIEYAFILCPGDIIEVKHLPQDLITQAPTENIKQPAKISNTAYSSELEQIKQALELNMYGRKATAQHLNISLSTLWRKMKKYQIIGTAL
ncbi:MAG: sigma 54-interacting transcriptional regulator [Bdellovibrionales bacterium]|jgi:PAS domain S-box-containing protein|nr:sigma 54-interacting transcriptional regulator [Bdellovibrionales bacterium]MBT3526981.1 sigma 54-interacting transcriptional regulator [Bdellovibrionales bacterium]MBT7669255.1 sigma 54-interacting transcriptional regulator [Bdellovibrionales bacterium]MBT7766137.1 sigma 54-interacting transcriptional regulator [Bdellovibrionales bacterium]